MAEGVKALCVILQNELRRQLITDADKAFAEIQGDGGIGFRPFGLWRQIMLESTPPDVRQNPGTLRHHCPCAAIGEVLQAGHQAAACSSFRAGALRAGYRCRRGVGGH